MTIVVATTPLFPPLVCPEDQQPLGENQDELSCPEGHRYKVRNGIARVVPSATGYTDAFGEQWNTYRATQLDSYTGTTISRDRLERCMGPLLWQRLQGSDRSSVLEAGCGAGRFSEVLLAAPGAVVTSTDLSTAVDASTVNCPISERHRVVQCDINAMPFRPGSYDIVVCLGVIQHTPSPDVAIEALYAQTKPGGWLVLDHYSASLAHYTKITALLLRPWLKRLSPSTGMAATDLLSNVFFPLHRAVKRRRLLQVALSRVSPLLTYFHDHPELDDRLQYEWARLDTHDSLTDYYKHFRTAAEMTRLLSRLGATEISVAKGGNGIEARCRKPSMNAGTSGERGRA